MLIGHRNKWVARAAFAVMLAQLSMPSSAQESSLPAADEALTSQASADFFRSFADFFEARRLFERETFGGNGRTCLTCHRRSTGTVSPAEAQSRFAHDPGDPLFLADGSDDGQGYGATRMLSDATILVQIALPDNVSLASDPTARSVVLRRGIPTTLNTPALDPVVMLDGREPNLASQAQSAIADHAQATRTPSPKELNLIAAFEHTPGFFSSIPLLLNGLCIEKRTTLG
ncbi:MAG: hypothetical protein ACREXP_09740 [Steroidobacteraceae bacterium]